MKQLVLALSTVIATLGAAQAQNAVPLPPMSADRPHFLLGMGISGGGDKLVSARYTDGSSVNLHAGGLVYFTAGVDYRITPTFSMQTTISYHVDQANARNGDIKFQRFPVEVIGYYQPNPSWRVGGGVRYANDPKLHGSGVVSDLDAKFESSTGAVIEAEWFSSPNVGFKLRYVNEKYKQLGYEDVDGSHVGVSANFYF